MTTTVGTLVELLKWRALHSPEQILYSFIEDGDNKKSEFTYAELDERAKAIASRLLTKINKNDRALLLYQPGLEYIEAFMGCLYAGVIPVPAYPPDGRNLRRLLHVIHNAEAVLALSTQSIYNNVLELAENGGTGQIKIESREFVQNIDWMPTDVISNDEGLNWKDQNISKDDVAFLQYTSGSTSNPKGVIITHHNLMTNFEFSHKAFGMHPNKQVVSWLPPYHDMGLIGGILQPLYSGVKATLMSPVSFIKRPLKWLNTIAEQGKDAEIISGAPNFAYDLCTTKIDETKIAALNLSNWTIAFNGAEPIRSETLEAFYQKFKVAGFKKEFFFPVYGLAEGTLLVTAGQIQALPKVKKINKSLLEQNIVEEDDFYDFVEKIGCGAMLEGQITKVVDVETEEECEENRVGEIWISGPNVAQGYWNNTIETTLTFEKQIKNQEDINYFRTGDLGYFSQGELYVTGRLKDLIIIRGKNHYPQDIEYTVQHSHEALREDCGSAISVDVNGEEELVIIQEIKRKYVLKGDFSEIISAIKSAVSKEHQLVPFEIVLIEPSSFPKTSSGKLQRRASKQLFLKNELKKLELESINLK